MITYGPIPISDNMYLSGKIEGKPHVFVQQRTLDGNPRTKRFSTPQGRSFTLGTTAIGNSIQGIWCQDVIDQLKTLQETGLAYSLDYHGDVYNVVIVDMSDITQMFQWEQIHSKKSYTGTIQFIEV